MRALVLDTGILIGIANADPVVRAFLQAAFENPASSAVGRVVPAVAVAECIRGSARDARVNQFLKHAIIDAADEHAARHAGALLGTVSGSATIDALVVAAAARRPGSLVVTVDANDLVPLCAAANVDVEILKH